jgi:hypothetical protein
MNPSPFRCFPVFPALLAGAVVASLSACADRGELPLPEPLPDTVPGRLPNSASFLMDEAETRIMNLLSEELDEGAFRLGVESCVEAGDDTIALYLTNRGDGRPPVTSFYLADQYGGVVDEKKVGRMRERIEHCRSRGLKVHLWVWADDSGFGDVDDVVHEAHLDRCVEHFDDLAEAWCVGLELDEVFRDRDRIARLTAALKSRTDRPVGVHFTRLDKWKWAVASGADVFFGQYGFGHTPEEIREMTEDVIRRLDGRVEFWAWEYHLSSRSPEAKALGDAAIRVGGVRGTGNGRNLRDGTSP